MEDLGAAITASLPRNGSAPMQAALKMAGHKVTGLGDGSADDDAATYGQLMAAISALAVVQTGAVQGFRSKTAPSGWVIENGGTIGSAASGATTRAHSDTAALFAHLWTQFTNTELPIQNSSGAATTRGASAEADFAANKRMPLFDSRSRFHRGSDSGLGYDANLTVGASQSDEIKSHGHGVTDPGHKHRQRGSGTPGGEIVSQYGVLTGAQDQPTETTTSTTGITIQSTGGSETRPRSSVLLFCIKL